MKSLFFAGIFLAPFLAFSQPKPDAAYKTIFVSRKSGDTSDKKDVVFEKVEVEASVDKDAWRSQLVKVLTPVLEKASRKKMKPGTYNVDVRFLVEKDGSISFAQALNDPGHGLAEAAVKAVKTGPHWTPGYQNGRAVRSFHTQPINFVISAE